MFSVLPLTTDIAQHRRHVGKVPILLQKPQNAERLIFRERRKQAAIADRCSLKRAAEVACEFVAGCSSPPHQYSIAAPTARKIFGRWCKKTFATKSANRRHRSQVIVHVLCATFSYADTVCQNCRITVFGLPCHHRVSTRWFHSQLF